MKKLLALLLALTAAVMLGVYLFSAQSGERSSSLSQEALELLMSAEGFPHPPQEEEEPEAK